MKDTDTNVNQDDNQQKDNDETNKNVNFDNNNKNLEGDNDKNVKDDNPQQGDSGERMFTQQEMEDAITKRVAREKKAAEKAVEQAQKLAQMNEEEKKEFQLQELQKELEELKRKDAYYGLSKEASKMLKEQGIDADEDTLQFVVKEDAEQTKESINSFVGLINRKVEEGVKKALAGESPKVNQSKSKELTKESIMAIKDPKKRIQAIRDNPKLFN